MVYDQGDKIAVQIKDTGQGIEKYKLSRIFKRFESFNDDKSKPSTGIGLSIVKELVDKHSAEILVESEKDRGTTFTVLFRKGVSHFNSDVQIKDTEEISKESVEWTMADESPINDETSSPEKPKYSLWKTTSIYDSS